MGMCRVTLWDVRGQLGGVASPVGGSTVPMVWDPVLNKKGTRAEHKLPFFSVS